MELKPTKTWLKGDKWLSNKPRENNNWDKPRENNNWEIHSSIDRSEMFLDKHIENVLRVSPKS